MATEYSTVVCFHCGATVAANQVHPCPVFDERVRAIAREVCTEALKSTAPSQPAQAADPLAALKGPFGQDVQWKEPASEAAAGPVGERCIYCGYPGGGHNEVCITRKVATLRAERDALLADNKGMLQAGGYEHMREQVVRLEKLAASRLFTGEEISKERDSLRTKLAAANLALDELADGCSQVFVNGGSYWQCFNGGTQVVEILKRTGRLSSGSAVGK